MIVGGTGLYIKALLENYDFAAINEKNELRKELESFADEYGNEALHAKLVILDKEEAERLHLMTDAELSGQLRRLCMGKGFAGTG